MQTRAGGRPASQSSFRMNRRTSLQRLSTRSPWKACKAMGQDKGGRFTRVRRADAGSAPTALQLKKPDLSYLLVPMLDSTSRTRGQLHGPLAGGGGSGSF